MRIDSHQHFWQYDPERDAWITDDMKVIQRDFDPSDLAPILRDSNMDGCIAVQASQSEHETHYLLQLAQNNSYIKGVVGWVDLRAENIKAKLESFSSFPLLKGFRHVVQGEPKGFLLQDSFMRGIQELQSHGFTYDILIYHHQLEEAIEFVKMFPHQKFPLDHVAKPAIAKGEISTWRKQIEAISNYPNVCCKISGLVTEADWYKWKRKDFLPYLDTVVAAFGLQRVMFGSDWPVCLVAASYKEVVDLVGEYMMQFAEEEQQQFWGLNASKFYNI